MNRTRYVEVINEQIERCKSILTLKDTEYCGGSKDPLTNVKQAAMIRGESVKGAIAGMMVKHTISIYDMISDGREHTIEKWDEKITDHINYLLMLKAAVSEEISEKRTAYRIEEISKKDVLEKEDRELLERVVNRE